MMITVTFCTCIGVQTTTSLTPGVGIEVRLSTPGTGGLHQDILVVIMANADRSTISQMMRTCRALNHVGTRYILEDDPELWHWAQVVSLNKFLSAMGQSVRRLWWLRGIKLRSPHFATNPGRSENLVQALNTLFTEIVPARRASSDSKSTVRKISSVKTQSCLLSSFDSRR